MYQGRTVCTFSPCQERTSNQMQTHSMSAVGFGIRFGFVILENTGIDHKIMGVAWVCPSSSSRFKIPDHKWWFIWGVISDPRSEGQISPDRVVIPWFRAHPIPVTTENPKWQSKQSLCNKYYLTNVSVTVILYHREGGRSRVSRNTFDVVGIRIGPLARIMVWDGGSSISSSRWFIRVLYPPLKGVEKGNDSVRIEK